MALDPSAGPLPPPLGGHLLQLLPGQHLHPIGVLPGGPIGIPGPPVDVAPGFPVPLPTDVRIGFRHVGPISGLIPQVPPGFHVPGGVIPPPQVNAGGPEQPVSDHAHATGVIQHLLTALQAARDPELKTSLSTALAALQKHVAGIHKEHQQMLQGKVSPRLMQEAYSHAPAARAAGAF